MASQELQRRLRNALRETKYADELLNYVVPTTGSVFYVSSTSATATANNTGTSPTEALLTVDQAINKCTANVGDVIYAMPGHAETIAAADGFDADVAGISIIGLGRGSARPTFTFSTTDSTVAVGANSVSFSNLRFVAGVSAVVVGVDVETTVTDFQMEDCEFYWGGTTGWDFADSVILRSLCHRATFRRNRFLAEPAVAGAARAIALAGASHNVRIENNEFMGDYSTACVESLTVLSQGLMFLDNLVHNTDAGEPYLTAITGTTGIIARTVGQAGGATIAANAVADAMSHCENFVTNTTGTIAIVKGAGGSPALDTD